MYIKILCFILITIGMFNHAPSFAATCWDNDGITTITGGERRYSGWGTFPDACYFYTTCTCNPGYRAVNNNVRDTYCVCSICPVNTYKTTTNQSSSCTNCPPGLVTTGYSASYRNEFTDCKCEKGKYYDGSTCQDCPVAANSVGSDGRLTPVFGTTSGYNHSLSGCYFPLSQGKTYDHTSGKFELYENGKTCSIQF